MGRNYTFIFLCIWSTALFALCVNADAEKSYSNDAKDFIKTVNQKLQLIHEEYVPLQEEYVTFDQLTAERQVELKNLLVKYQNIFKNIELERNVLLSQENLDADTKQALSQLKVTGGMLNIGVDMLKLLSNLEITEEIVHTEKGILSDNNEALFEVDLHDLEKTKKNWQRWYDKFGANADVLIFQTVDFIRKHAHAFEMNPVSFWYPSTTSVSFDDIDQIMKDLKPFYKQLHAFLRHKLKEQFGNEIISNSGRIPEHLYKNMQLNVWNDETYVPVKKTSSATKSYQAIFDNLNYNASNLIEVAENFYTSLGFDPFSEDIKTNHFLEASEKSLFVHPGSVYGYDANVSLYYSNRTDIEAYGVHHSLLWHIYNGLLQEKLPRYFQDDYDFGIALGVAIKLSALSKNHLPNIGIKTNEEETNAISLDINIRMAISSTLSIVYQYVEMKILTGLLTGYITKSNLNSIYWQTMAEYAGVEAPVERDLKTSVDVPYSVYATLTQCISLTGAFATNFLSYQFYEAICDKIDHKGVLSDCDFYGNKDVGTLLKEIISLGTSKPYNEMLSMILKDKLKLNVNAFLKYFEPTQNYISELKLTTGWKEDL